MRRSVELVVMRRVNKFYKRQTLLFVSFAEPFSCFYKAQEKITGRSRTALA